MSREDWDRLSSFYHFFLKHNKELYRSIAEEIRPVIAGMDILDLGCGNGEALFQYAGSASRITAVDYSAKQIEEAKKRNSPYRIDFEVHDAAYLPYSPRSFDAAVLCNVLDQVSQPEKILSECGEVLKDDGLLITVTYVGKPENRDAFYKQSSFLKASLIYHTWTPESCMNFLEEQGWMIRDYRILGNTAPYLFCICCRKQRSVVKPEVISTSAEDFYLPLMGRIYGGKHFPKTLDDPEALQLSHLLPQIAAYMPSVSEYTMVSYAALYHSAEQILVRYMNLLDLPAVNVYAGLNTLALSNPGKIFYELDEPDHLAIRESMLPSSWTDRYLPFHMLDARWIHEICKNGANSILINACGAFRNRQTEDVIQFMNMTAEIGTVYILFDADTSANGGILVTRDTLEDKTMPSFTIDRIEDFIAKISGECSILEQMNLFAGLSRRGMKPDTLFRMELVEHLGLRKVFLLRIKKSS